MKKTLITILISTVFLTSFSQDFTYEIHGKYERPVKNEMFAEAKLVSDFIEGYPVNWIKDYVSVEISSTLDGIPVKATSTTEVLTFEQQNLLKRTGLGTALVISVVYKSKNAATDLIEIQQMKVSMTVVPDVEAEFIGGKELLNKYFKENGINNISEASLKQIQQGVINFTITEKGDVANAKITKTSGDLKTDKLLLKAIYKMPKWKPAEDENGKKVKQKFVFSVTNNMAAGIGC
jgi:TonB family protein